jgi:hypothetical protein
MESMESKRANEHANANANTNIKRVKTDFPLEIELDGIVYINLSCLLKTAPFAAYFAKHYKKSEKQLIEDDKLELETFNVTMTNVANGVFDPRWPYRPGSDLRLVMKDGKINEFIKRAQGASCPMAPPIILDDDLAFTDSLGNKYEVELRGERTEGGIFFKVKDVGFVCGTISITDDIQHNTAAAKEGEDYAWFTIPENERKKRGSSRELFFTAQGLYNYCRSSTILNCSASHGFIYLVHLGDEMYKFGKSWVLDSRLKKHKTTFKSAGFKDIRPVYSAKIDIKHLSAAEQAVKLYLQMHGWYRSTNYSSELCELDDNGLEQVKSCYDNLEALHFTGTPYTPRFNARSLAEKLMMTLAISDTVPPHDGKDLKTYQTACVYLLETANPSRQENGITKRVYKFGRSKNVEDRTYGHGSVIDTLIFIPVNHLSEAETKLKHTLGKKYAYEDGTQTELLLLSADERNTVRNAMRTVGETFYGETLVHTHQLEMLKKDHELELITSKKDSELSKKDIVILEMKNEIQAHRIKELEDKLWLYKTNNANAA